MSLLQRKLQSLAAASVITLGLAACGGGGSSGGDNPPANPPPVEPIVSFGQTVSDLVDQGSTTLFDGSTYDTDSPPIEMSNYEWEIDDSDVDEGPLDDPFSG